MPPIKKKVVANRPEGVESKPNKPKSAMEMLTSMASGAKTNTKKSSDKVRLELELSEYGQNLYLRYVPAKRLAEVALKTAEAVRGEFNREAMSSWMDLVWINKSVPNSPVIKIRDPLTKSVDCEGMFTVTEKIKPQFPDKDNPVNSLINGLIAPSDKYTDALELSDAEELVENELEVTPQIGLRPLTELLEGKWEDRQFIESTAEEKAIANKVVALLQKNLSQEELDQIMYTTPKTVVKKGFLQRVAGYVKSKQQLARALQYFVPEPQNRKVKFAVSDNDATRRERLSDYAKELLGTVELDEE